MTTSLRLLFLSTFLICVLSAAPPKFYLIKTGAEDGQVEEAASSEEKVNKKTTPTISARPQGESPPQSEGVGIRTMAES